MVCGGSDVMRLPSATRLHVGQIGNAARPGEKAANAARGHQIKSCECAMRGAASHAASPQAVHP